MKEHIKEQIQSISKRFAEDEKRFGGYTAMERLHDSAPEDYIESRTDWSTLSSYADDMYSILSDVKERIDIILELLNED